MLPISIGVDTGVSTIPPMQQFFIDHGLIMLRGFLAVLAF
jgi:hypothetical protein